MHHQGTKTQRKTEEGLFGTTAEESGRTKKHKRQRAPARWRLVLNNACRCSVELGRGLLKLVRQGDAPLAITRALSTRSLLAKHALYQYVVIWQVPPPASQATSLREAKMTKT